MRQAIISNATGAQDIAVIIVRFPSAGTGTTGAGSQHLISSLANFNTYFTAMQSFFTENSFGAMTLNISFFGDGADADGEADATIAQSFLMPGSMSSYGCGDVDAGTGCGTSSGGVGGAVLIRDAISAARATRAATFNTTNFDAVLVMHAGYGNETTSNNGDIWSAFYQEEGIIDDAGGGFIDGAVFPELESSGISSPLGVICHEFGHVLTLPDLYNTSVFGGASVVGSWDLMDAGPYLDGGTNPAHLGAWCKTYLGWATPQVISGRTSVSLQPVESGPATSIVKIPVQNGGAQEYFMVEYRSTTAGNFDQNIAGTGLLIWHVDDDITDAKGFSAVGPDQNRVNTGSPHYGVSIVTANGTTISNVNQGSVGHVFTTGSFTSPKSNNFAGQASGTSVVNIAAGPGISPATFEVINLGVTAGQVIKKAINFPNPAGKGYGHPRGEGHSTLQFHLGRPANQYQINIYTLSGDLVRKIPMSEITLNTDRSVDERWIYEYVWDLRNGSGDHVAPGVYLFLVRADGESKSAKAVIIR
jgi:M6 family metalloprotease-like protein